MSGPIRGAVAGAAVAAALVLTASAAAAPRISFYAGLKRAERPARAAFFAVGNPGSARYRHFLSLGQVARRYGASPATRRRVRRAARQHGLVARVDRSGVFARLTGTPRRLGRVLHVRVRKQFDNDDFSNGWFIPDRARPRLPADLRRVVRGGLVAAYNRTHHPRSARRAGPRALPPGPGNGGTWTGGCDAAKATGAYAPGQVRHAYGIDAVGTGAGAKVAILNAGEGVTTQDERLAARCFGYGTLRPRTLLTDGQTRPFGRGSFEPQEDLALVRGMAPGLRSITYSQAWETQEQWFLGADHVLLAPDRPDTFSISYGVCERQMRGPKASTSDRASARLMDAVLVRLGLVGVASFASAGDSGSTCNGQPFAGVAWPGSSPFLTAVGGTRLAVDAANRRTDEVVWNDLAWAPADNGGGAGGGGLSLVSARPPYQRRLDLPGARRAVPDVAAHASMFPGWPVNIGSDWVQDGGTSASSPLVAAGFAVLSARERAAGRPPLGPVGGLLYRLRARSPGTLYDIVSGNNGFTAKVPARVARPGYDLASGLGVPQFGALAGALPPPG